MALKLWTNGPTKRSTWTAHGLNCSSKKFQPGSSKPRHRKKLKTPWSSMPSWLKTRWGLIDEIGNVLALPDLGNNICLPILVTQPVGRESEKTGESVEQRKQERYRAEKTKVRSQKAAENSRAILRLTAREAETRVRYPRLACYYPPKTSKHNTTPAQTQFKRISAP